MRSVMAAPAERAEGSSAEHSEPLAEIVALLRPKAVLSKIVSGAGAWSIRKPPYVHPAFCLVLEGSCFLHPDGLDLVELGSGDFLLLPETPAFTLASDLTIKPRSLPFDHSRESRYGTREGPPTMRLVGGYFQLEDPSARLLVRLLPAVIHIRRDEAGATRLRRIATLIDDEAKVSRAGRDLILERLVDVLLVEALRLRTASLAPEARGLVAGLCDPALARALHEIHAKISRRWTVDDLARIACMSRAVFAERFMRKIGVPPMQYIVNWRMALAKDMLRRERSALTSVAERVGYRSASAFSTAFTRLNGCSPSDFAQRCGATPLTPSKGRSAASSRP